MFYVSVLASDRFRLNIWYNYKCWSSILWRSSLSCSYASLFHFCPKLTVSILCWLAYSELRKDFILCRRVVITQHLHIPFFKDTSVPWRQLILTPQPID